jgi:hypothetical protein
MRLMNAVDIPRCDTASSTGPICATPQFSALLIDVWTRLDQPAIGNATSLLRERFGLSRSDLARRMRDAAGGHGVGADPSLIYRWEKGDRGRPRPRPGMHYRRLLGLVCERELSNTNPVGRVDFLRRLSMVTNVALLPPPIVPDEAEPPALDLIEDMTALTRHYVRMHGTMPPSALRLAIARHLEDLNELVLRSNSPSISLRVLSLTAQTAILAGWMSFEDGDRGQATRHWSVARELARDADNHGVQALALGSRSRNYWTGGRASNDAGIPAALRLLNDAIRLAEVAGSPALLAWLNARKMTLVGEQPGDESDAEWNDVLDDLIANP